MKRSLPVLIALLFLFLKVGWSVDFWKGFKAYQKKDYRTALREFRPLAEKGHSQAQNIMGWMYYYGEGIPQSYKTAVKWYRLAAEQGQPYAQYWLAEMYQDGKGVLQNYVYAYMWLNIAASRGYKRAVEVRSLAATVMAPSQIERAQDLASECVKKKFKGCDSSFTDPP